MSLPVSDNPQMAQSGGQPSPTQPVLGEFAQSSSREISAATMQSTKTSPANSPATENDANMSDEIQTASPGNQAVTSTTATTTSTTTTAPISAPVVLGIVPGDKPRARVSAGTTASKKGKKTSKAAESLSSSSSVNKANKVVKNTRKRKQPQSTTSSSNTDRNARARLSLPESATDTRLSTVSDNGERNPTISSAIQSLMISNIASDARRQRLPLRSAATTTATSTGSIFGGGNQGIRSNGNASRLANMNEQQQLLSSSQTRSGRARDTMRIDFILNDDFARNSASASASHPTTDAAAAAAAASPGPSYAFSDLSDFDKEFFFTAASSRPTTASTATTTASAVTAPSMASSTTLSPHSNNSAAHLVNADRDGDNVETNTWLQTRATTTKNNGSKSNVQSTRERPLDRNLEVFMRPENRLYEDALLEVLDGLELPIDV